MYVDWDVENAEHGNHVIEVTINKKELDKLTDEYNLLEDLLRAKLPILYRLLYEFVGQR